jgi:hypothetical protein
MFTPERYLLSTTLSNQKFIVQCFRFKVLGAGYQELAEMSVIYEKKAEGGRQIEEPCDEITTDCETESSGKRKAEG